MVKKSPLSAVCVTAEDQIYILIFQQRPVFRMMGEQDVVAGCGAEVHNPVRLWLMSSGAGGTSDAVQILSAWIPRFGRLCGSESSIVCNVARSETGQNNLSTINADVCPLIIQRSDTCGRQEPEILRVNHPLVIAEGEVGRGGGGASTKEWQDILLRLQWRLISLRSGPIQHIAGDADEIRTVRAEGRNHRCGIFIVQVTQQRQGHGAVW